ncbi:hypothetical protein GALMADRAFT_250787 [Galerina marginata CBS 339.88]|uniref:DUF4470 domain-containing protein n=1 Tax=Galerina marginata (strain CBS 339.88) TaxID=685588 RepID=A0A067ST51_GALM3|nr:hypothetical protein GALMADRAFT_250787 [Galerina marginata CBS 339.88]
MAEELNEKGNTFYKAGEFGKAQQFFAEASNVSPEEPKYSSNLSAALYEEGKYKESIQSIVRSWQKIQAKLAADGPNSQSGWDALSLKLAVRFAKANLHQAAGAAVTILHLDVTPSGAADNSARDNEETAADIERYVTSTTESPSDIRVKDMTGIWDQWKAIRAMHSSHTAAECLTVVSDAQVRFRGMKIYKCASEPTLEHYNFGHDNIHSLLDGIREVDDTLSMKLDLHDERERQTSLSFLFGGSGDARHAFGTLLDIGCKLRKDVLDGRDTPDVHLTLVDIHPATLARTLVIFELLHRITGVEDKRLKLETTLFYLYMCLAVPDYCNEIIMNIAKDLSTSRLISDQLPRWLHISPNSVAGILEVLQYWSEPLQKSTKILLELQNDQFSVPQRTSIWRGLQLATSTTSTESYKDARTEELIYDRLRILLPPKSLLELHPAIAKLTGTLGNNSETRTLISAATDEVHKTWKPNPTLFDKTSTEHPMFSDVPGYPVVTMNPFQTLSTFKAFNIRLNPQATLPFGRAAISIMSTFFRDVINTIALLGDHLMIEVVQGDVISGLSKLVAGDLGKRPHDFPITFTRIWLSNVPDYTNGLLNSAVFVLPHHPLGSNNAIVPITLSNCLLNTAAFGSIDDFCYNYTLLRQDDLEKFLGCSLVVSDRSMFGSKQALLPASLPRPVSMLASKAALHKWLSHLLLCIVCNGIPLPPPRRVDLPNNLNAFFRLLVHLHRVGFPSHWIGEFVQMVVSDSLITNMNPYLGRLPIQKSAGNNTTASRKVYLNAWQAELELIFAISGPALPFFVAIPKHYPSLDDIHTYRATVKPIDLERRRFFPHWAPLSSPFVMTAGLIFYEPNENFGAELLAHQISFILEGDPDFTAVQKQIMLGVDHVDLSKGEVRWRMSKKWFEKLRKEKWEMAVYRTDLTIAATDPLSAASWEEML